MTSPEELRDRTKRFALRVIRLVNSLPNNVSGRTIGNQLIRSGTSVGVNYRACCRAKSQADFIAKLGIVIEEADESAFWLELIVESKIMKPERIESLLSEANELIRIFTASRQTARQNKSKKAVNHQSQITNHK